MTVYQGFAANPPFTFGFLHTMTTDRRQKGRGFAASVLWVLGLLTAVRVITAHLENKRYEIEKSCLSARIRITSSAKKYRVVAPDPAFQLYEMKNWKMSVRLLTMLFCDTVHSNEEDKVELTYSNNGGSKLKTWSQNVSYNSLEGRVDLESMEIDDLKGQTVYLFPKGQWRLSAAEFLLYLYLDPVDGECPKNYFPCFCNLPVSDALIKNATRCVPEIALCDEIPNCSYQNDEDSPTCGKTPPKLQDLTMFNSCETLKEYTTVSNNVSNNDPNSMVSVCPKLTPVLIWTVSAVLNRLFI